MFIYSPTQVVPSGVGVNPAGHCVKVSQR